MSTTPLTEREEFEAWMSAERKNRGGKWFKRDADDGSYWALDVDEAWKAWQERAARASALLPPVGGVQDSQSRGTDAQILKERELTCSAALGAMAFGSFGHAPPPADSEWLRPFWQAGKDLSAAERAWRPISTAPKDGTMFLVWVSAVKYREDEEGRMNQDDSSAVDFASWRVVDEAPDGGHIDAYAGPHGDSERVTHWMPLPAAPTDSASSIRSDRQEAVPHEQAPVPASSPVAPQAEPVAWQDPASTWCISARDKRLSGEAADCFTTPLFAAPQGDGLLRQASATLDHVAIFLRNGIALGYIRMPDADCPDPAKLVPGEVDACRAALRQYLPKDPA